MMHNTNTCIFQFFIFASGAQATLIKNTDLMGRALAAGVGLMNAVYCGYNASGKYRKLS